VLVAFLRRLLVSSRRIHHPQHTGFTVNKLLLAAVDMRLK